MTLDTQEVAPPWRGRARGWDGAPRVRGAPQHNDIQPKGTWSFRDGRSGLPRNSRDADRPPPRVYSVARRSRDPGPHWPSRARVSSARGGSPATGPPDWGPAPTTAPYRESSPQQPGPAHNFRRTSPFPRPVSLILLESNLDFSRTVRLILPSRPHPSLPGHCSRLSSATYESGMFPPSRVLPSLSQGRLQSSPRLRLLVYLLGVTSADHHPPFPSTTFCLSPC